MASMWELADRSSGYGSASRAAARAARNMAEELIKDVGISGAPIDPERVARHLGVTVIFKEFSEADISGVFVSTGGSSVVCVNRTHPRVRRRSASPSP